MSTNFYFLVKDTDGNDINGITVRVTEYTSSKTTKSWGQVGGSTPFSNSPSWKRDKYSDGTPFGVGVVNIEINPKDLAGFNSNYESVIYYEYPNFQALSYYGVTEWGYGSPPVPKRWGDIPYNLVTVKNLRKRVSDVITHYGVPNAHNVATYSYKSPSIFRKDVSILQLADGTCQLTFTDKNGFTNVSVMSSVDNAVDFGVAKGDTVEYTLITEVGKGTVTNKIYKDSEGNSKIVGTETDCDDGYILEGGYCVLDTTCPTGKKWGGDKCITDTTCIYGEKWDGDKCVLDETICPTGQKWDGSKCVLDTPTCLKGYHLEGNVCILDDEEVDKHNYTIYIKDASNYPISNAVVTVLTYILKTDSEGKTVFSLNPNERYTVFVSADGYIPTYTNFETPSSDGDKTIILSKAVVTPKCQAGYHLEGNVCIPDDDEEVDDTPKCQAGYHLERGICVKDTSNNNSNLLKKVIPVVGGAVVIGGAIYYLFFKKKKKT